MRPGLPARGSGAGETGFLMIPGFSEAVNQSFDKFRLAVCILTSSHHEFSAKLPLHSDTLKGITMTRFDMEEYQNTIYHDALRYDDEHWWKKDDMEFWKKMLEESSGNRVLELAAGTGRLALPLIRAGADYTGIEISPEFVERANLKIKPEMKGGQVLPGDIRDFHLDETFDLIFIGFNSFLHMLTNDDATACLLCVREHMHENSRFIIDIFRPDPLFLYRPENRRFPTMEYMDSETQKRVTVEESNVYDPETEINKIRWYYSTEEKNDDRIYDFSMRMFWPDTMNRLLTDAGFTILHVWGNYEKKDFDEESNLQIYVAKI